MEQEGTLRLKIRQLRRKFKRKFSFQSGSFQEEVTAENDRQV